MNIKKGFSLFLVICLMLVTAGCGGKTGQAITCALSQEPVTLDPQIANDAAARTVITALYEGLVRLDENNQPTPGVAERWESNADATSFTFYLRKTAKWSNGDPVTAHDFQYAITRALDPQTGSTTYTPLLAIQNAAAVVQGAEASQLGVTVLDDYTLRFDLAYSCDAFPAMTALPVFMPCNRTFFTQSAGKYGLDANYILGNGPFRMTNRYSWEHNQYINLSAASTYSGHSPVLPSTLTFSIGTVDVSDTKSRSVFALSSAADLANAQAAGYTISASQEITWGLCLNTQNTVLQSTAVRRAFLQTLNRESLLQYIPAGCTTADDIITPDMTFLGKNYRSFAGEDYYLRQDVTAVSAALSALSAQGLSKLPSLSVLCPDDPSIKKMVNEMLASWNTAFGTYFNMEPLSQTELENRVQTGDYAIALYAVRPTNADPGSLLSQFSSTSRTNPANFHNTEYDALLQSAQQQSHAAAVAQYAKAEQLLNEQGVFYPIYYQKRYYAVSSALTGIVLHPYDMGLDFRSAAKA